MVPLRWLRAFLNHCAGTIQRMFILSPYVGTDDQISILFDASLGRAGGVLLFRSVPAIFSPTITGFYCEILDFERGLRNSQRICESLALLVALRTWPVSVATHTLLSVNSDSCCTLDVESSS